MHETISGAVRSAANKRPPIVFSSQERREVFRGMVVGELEAGFLRYSRRQALLRYASLLGIPEFEASLLIAEAQYRSGDIEPISFDSVATLANVSRPNEWSIPLRLSFALVAAMSIDVVLIYWLFG